MNVATTDPSLDLAAATLKDALAEVEQAASLLRAAGPALTDAQAGRHRVLSDIAAGARRALPDPQNRTGDPVKAALALLLVAIGGPGPLALTTAIADDAAAALGEDPHDYLAARGLV